MTTKRKSLKSVNTIGKVGEKPDTKRSVPDIALVYCDLCTVRGGAIATVDLNKLSLPMTGKMFGSIDVDHGYPAPFDSRLEWRHFKCPRCPHRPFFDEKEISISKDNGLTHERYQVPTLQHRIDDEKE